MQAKNWKLISVDQTAVDALQSALKIHPVLCEILVQRGIKTFDEAKHFFRPSLTDLHDPFLMKDMDMAVNRIIEAIGNGEKILIYGDYDVDGTTSVALVFLFLKNIYANIDYYIPNRYKEGYGISFQGIDFAAANNFSLIIALDCGIKAVDKVAYASEKNIDFIICDHHEPGDELPQAVATLDPKRKDCSYPYKELSGCGVGFKLLQALALQQSLPSATIEELLDLVAVSIASDIVPINGENRILAFYGLKKLNENPTLGLKAIKEVSGLSTAVVDVNTVVFSLGPRINAAGRVDDAKHAVTVLINDEANFLSSENAKMLQDFNEERKNLDKQITEEALAEIEKEQYKNRKSTVLYNENWHKGVIGIVASRLIDVQYKPTIILTLSDGKVTGSARSIKGFDLYEAIYSCKDYLIQFGGHKFAAGLTMQPEQVENFATAFEKIAQAQLTAEMMVPEIMVDVELPLEEISETLFNILEQMAPFGPENMRPVFMTKNLCDSGWSKIVKDEHLRISVRMKNGKIIDGIGFGLAKKWEAVDRNNFALCYQLQMNEWNGNRNLQLLIKDIK